MPLIIGRHFLLFFSYFFSSCWLWKKCYNESIRQLHFVEKQLSEAQYVVLAKNHEMSDLLSF